ncbi:MAG: CARDB domain-containing protein [Gemmataceae bacterium]
MKPVKVPVEVRPYLPSRSEAAVPVTPSVVEMPTGRQEPAVTLEWGGSGVAKIGQISEYTLTIKNTSVQPVQSVSARVRLPQGLSLVESLPKAADENGLLMWDLGTMMPRQERVLHLKLRADAKGDMMPQAWVTFTGAAAMRLRVREPKLTVKIQSPEKVLVGDATQFTLVISNPGDGSADAVKISAVLSSGLEHARGNKLDFEIGSLSPGESRNVTLLCASRAGGVQKVDVTAIADHGLKATDSCPVQVIMPRLDISIVGPRLRYLDRKARYTLKVTNPGDAPATNVTVADIVPAGFKVLAASHGGRWDSQTRMVSWFLGEIAPGDSREVEMEVQAVSSGNHTHKATAVGARGLRAECELTTKVEGVAAMLVELIDTEDPIEVNGETVYEVRITNTGSKTETDIKLVATVPDEMQFKNADGPVRYREEGKTILFEPIERLAPRADAIFRIKVKTLKAGSIRFKIQVSSANLTEPVVKMEPTRIYADAPEGEK